MFEQTAAALFLTLLAIVPPLALARRVWQLPFATAQSLLYLATRALTRLRWRMQVVQPLHFPDDRGALLICNHHSSIDPMFIQSCLRRKTHWLVAREYCEIPGMGWFLRMAEVIPVGRGGVDTRATRTAIRLVESGELVGVFPEGRINMSRDFMMPYRPGAILIALKGRVPLIPCYIAGSPYDGRTLSPFFMRARVRLYFGEPLDLSAYYDTEPTAELLRELMERGLHAIADLAGRPDFKPRPAGKRWKPTEEELDVFLEAKQREFGYRA